MTDISPPVADRLGPIRLNKKDRRHPSPGNHNHDGVNSRALSVTDPIAAKMSKSTIQTVLNTIEADITWNQADYDTHGIARFGGNNDFLIAEPGLYVVKYLIKWVSGVNNTIRKNFLYLNGVLQDSSLTFDPASSFQGSGVCKGAVDLLLEAGDIVKLTGYHNNGSPLDITNAQGGSWFSIHSVYRV